MDKERIRVWVQHFPDRGNLVLQWHDPVTGKRKSRSAKTNDEGKAEIARQELETDLNRGQYREPSKTTWEDFRKAFEEEYVAPLRKNTRLNYRVCLDHFERLVKVKRMDSIDARTISAFAAGLRKSKGRSEGQGQGPLTVKIRLQQLHTALAWARTQGMLAEVPVFPRVKVPDRKPAPVPADDVARLLDACREDRQMQVYLLCAWLCGLRLREAYQLRWSMTPDAPWLDLPNHKVILPAGFVKGVADQWVPLDPALEKELALLPRRPGDDLVFRFTHRYHGEDHAISASRMSKRVAELASKVGVRMTFKTLRRGFGCRYAGKVPAQVLQKLMRHANIATTMKFYANVDEAVMAAVRGAEGT